MMYRRKSPKPLKRMAVEVWFSKEKIAFLESVKVDFNMSRRDVYMEGIRHLLEKKKDVISKIFASDYVLVYKARSTGNMVLKPRANVNYQEMYVYHIEALSSINYRVYYKDDPSMDDYNFKVWRQNKRLIHRDVLDEFPISPMEEIPE